MAKQNGILKFRGTIDDLNFYQSQDGQLVRKKTSVDAARIASDPSFIRTRENGAEFGAAGKAGKIIRDALKPLMADVADNRVTSRITKLMSDIRKLDKTSVRGKRTPAIGLQSAEGKALLKGFNFNIDAVLSSVLSTAFTVDTATGVITLQPIVPLNDILFPPAATHLVISGGFANVDLASGVYELQQTSTPSTPIDAQTLNITLNPPAVPAGTGTKLFLLKIEFFQNVNGADYSLNNGAYNALSIVEVA
ncbi:MAG: hypothetical protein JWO58_2120 [Chitinophagaceae bacterium]|nr:hypothetical protein [Chitinophagaceae bacterium]